MTGRPFTVLTSRVAPDASAGYRDHHREVFLEIAIRMGERQNVIQDFGTVGPQDTHGVAKRKPPAATKPLIIRKNSRLPPDWK
jgi:hypothetical protein